ncbi:MAG: phospholipid carrier-dependent glycosyltransferase [Phycisphaerae bacterium]|nr:phospholipid carrier-dependent glycosyltransferase [Phycisphaerae bacterium]
MSATYGSDRSHRAAWHGPFCFVFSMFVAAFGMTIARGSVAHMDIMQREQTDLRIAEGLRSAPMFGARPTLEPARLRLPMYVNALASWWTGRSDLAQSRDVSAFAGAVTVVAAAGLANLQFGMGTGLLTAVLLAFAPYFLAYSRLAMTEGDVFFACFATLGLWGYSSYLRAPTAARWLLAAILFGLSLGTTVLAFFLLPVFWVLSATTYSEPAFRLSRMPDHTRRLNRLLAWQFAIILVTALIALLDRYPPDQPGLEFVARHARTSAIVGWGVLALMWLATIVYVLSIGILSRSRGERFRAFAAMGFSSFFVLMPVHLLDPCIARELIIRGFTWDHHWPFALILDQLRLCSGVLLLKLTVPVGIVTVLALIYAMLREREDSRWRPCIVATVIFVIALCSLPQRQSCLLMGIYPLVVITTAGALVGTIRWVRELRSTGLIVAWLLVFAAGVAIVGFESRRAWPDYQVYGAELLSDRTNWRWLGADSRGSCNLIQTSCDGVESVIEWCESSDTVFPGARVVSFFWEDGIVRSALPERPRYVFVPRGGTSASDELPAPPAIHNADFVLLHVNNVLGYCGHSPDMPAADELNTLFEPVFTVKRGPLEVAWVYGRKPR